MKDARYSKKAMLVITDGIDNRSKSTLEQVVARASREDVMIFTVGLLSQSGGLKAEDALISIAQAFKPDFERFGVTISVINPGFVKTPLTDKNEFPMPFLIPVDAAIDHILRGIARKQFEIAFPWQTSFLIHLLASLPNRLKFAITRRMLPRR